MKKIDKKKIENVLALTPMQEGILFQYLRTPGSRNYFEQLSLTLSGKLDKTLFEKAWNTVIENNETLRTVFRWEKLDKPVQIILKEHILSVNYYDFSKEEAGENHPAASAKHESEPGRGLQRKSNTLLIEEMREKDRDKKFDLRNVPFRVTLCKLSEEQYEVIISNYHIIYDGWSNGIILKEYFKAYNDSAAGKQLHNPVKNRFSEFVKWHQKQDPGGREKYWRTYLKGFDTQIKLPVKEKRNTQSNKRGGKVEFRLEKNLKRGLEDFVLGHKITLASFMYGAWALLLQRYTNSDDIVFGTTVSGRNAKIKGIEDIVGLFINTLPLRVQTAPKETAAALFCRVDRDLRTREAYEAASPAEIKGYGEIDNTEELFDTIVIVENYPLDNRLMSANGKSDLSLDSYSMVESTHYDLSVSIMVLDDIDVIFTYNEECLDEETVVGLSSLFGCLVENTLSNPGKEAVEIELITEEEKHTLLHRFNDTAVDYPREKTIHQLFEEQTERTPDTISAVGSSHFAFPGQSKRFAASQRQFPVSITYRQLNENANRLAGTLRSAGLRVGELVALMPGRTLEMLMGLLAILKAGGVYIPLGPEFPEDRCAYILKECGVSLVLTGSGRKAPEGAVTNINLDMEESYTEKTSNPVPSTTSSDPAYVIYTSGTTGNPKGVIIEHRALVNFVKGITDRIPFRPGDGILSLTTPAFDIFGLETLLPLAKGARVVIGNEQEQINPAAMASVLERERITIFQLTPSRLQLILSDPPASRSLGRLKSLLVGGEAFPANLLEKTKEVTRGKLFNVYGPTETTIWSTVKDVSPGQELNIGTPIANTRIYILSKHGKLQPIGVPGELYIAGDGLAAGYFNNEKLSKEKFLADPFAADYSIPGSKMYKTGDLAKWLHDGNIECLGRLDHQVKIRGFRIELGEIENQLQLFEGVKDAVVLVRELEDNKYLCAYLIADGAIKFELLLSGLRETLSKKLPAYMIPGYFVQIDSIPLSINGKVDRKALPAPGSLGEEKKFRAPKNLVEKSLAKVWEKVLGKHKLSTNDNFFMLGGDSIKSIQVASRMAKKGYTVEVGDIFRFPSISELAPKVGGKCSASGGSPRAKGRLPLEPRCKGSKPAFDAGRDTGAFADISMEKGEQRGADFTYNDLPAEVLEKLEKQYPVEDIYPLSPMQEGMLFHSLYLDKRAPYFVQISYRLHGTLDIRFIEKALKALLKRHEILRAAFVYEDLKRPLQVVLKNREIDLHFEDIRGNLPGEEKEHIVSDFKVKDKSRFFDLGKDILIRLAIFRVSETEYDFTWSFHHILMDGWCLSIVNKEFFEIYKSILGNRPNRLPSVTPYGSYIRWLERQDKEIQRRYWRNYLEGYEKQATIPQKMETGMEESSYKIDGVTLIIDSEKTGSLQQLAGTHRVTLNSIFQTVWGIILGLYNGTRDVVFGTVVSGRPAQLENVESMIGLFINTIPVRVRYDKDATFHRLLREVGKNAIEAGPHHYYPLAGIQSETRLKQGLLDHLLVFENFPDVEQLEESGPGDGQTAGDPLLSFSNTNFVLQTSYDFYIYIVMKPEKELEVVFKFNSSLYPKEFAKRAAAHFEEVIHQVIANPRMAIAAINLIDRRQKNTLLQNVKKRKGKYQAGDTKNSGKQGTKLSAQFNLDGM
ncbi:MAG: amino acid adenylation domain-containing protein [bacterium]|nr:amino acid adenylation domain-containing protein [bacterium]